MAPPIPDIPAERKALVMWTLSTLIPLLAANSGLSATALILLPSLVLFRRRINRSTDVKTTNGTSSLVVDVVGGCLSDAICSGVVYLQCGLGRSLTILERIGSPVDSSIPVCSHSYVCVRPSFSEGSISQVESHLCGRNLPGQSRHSPVSLGLEQLPTCSEPEVGQWLGGLVPHREMRSSSPGGLPLLSEIPVNQPVYDDASESG